MRAKAYIVHRAMCEPELEWSKPKDCLSAEPLYTSPPAQQEPDNSNDLTIAYLDGVQRGKELAQRTWVGLTDEEEVKLWESTDSDWELMKRVEAKLKEKNT